ncbi:MAG TPA: NAD(+) synthase [Acidobacteriota bacterium]|nr:NAD(+) synthase [Acidobacteriota bacterium]
MKLTKGVLAIQADVTCCCIEGVLRNQVFHQLRRKGAVVGLSGGVDSSVVASLCVRALGKDRVLGLFMPETESSPQGLELARSLAEQLGMETVLTDITPILRALGCYSLRDQAIQQVIPGYGPGYRCKLVLPGILEGSGYNVFSVVVESPAGVQTKARLTAKAYLGIVAATNFKQRTRKMLEYYHTDRLQYAVAGTPNRLEYDLGFFVKNGDGAADVKPIAHLYKTQVYQLAEYLGIPEEIRRQPPTTDTYPLSQTQEEFYFALPLEELDLCLYGVDHHVPPFEVGEATGLTTQQVERVYAGIVAKRHATTYLHLQPLLF